MSETKRTVYYALAANLLIAVAKAIGGAVSGSAAMLAEAAHSLADTTNQVFLRISLTRAERGRDEDHPFGYGSERFFWAFLAAVFIFVAGALFSIFQGIERLLKPESGGRWAIAMAVLVVALVAESISLLRALRQSRAEAAAIGQPVRTYIATTRDPTAKTVVFEDSAAVVGVLIAMAGITADQLAGTHMWDAVASIGIGLLLAVVAFTLGRDIKGLLIGEAARPAERERLREVIERHDGVDELLELLTMALGPNALLVAARLDLRDGLTSDEIEDLATELDEQLREAVPEVREVFLDPTPRQERRGRRRRPAVERA